MSGAGSNSKTAGVSLTQDALRRLRKNPTAMISVGVLVTVVGLALITPILPLQPPDRDLTTEAFARPTSVMPWNDKFKLWETTFDFTPEVVERSTERLPEAQERLRTKRKELSDVVADPQSTEEAETLARRDFRRARAAVTALQQRAYSNAGFPQLGVVSRWMVRTRYALFGEGQIASICGRDKLGRDILSRIFWGARVSLIVGVVATLVSLVIGVTWGAVAGYVGGSVDNAMMRIVDVLYSVPFVFLVIFLISILSEDRVKDALAGYGIDRITIFYFVVGAIYWLTMARVVRGQVVSLRNEPFIEAARSLGVSQTAIVFRHLVPNLLSIVVVYLTLTIPRVILFEAFLSFLGLGVEPPDVSWGLLANEGIQVITKLEIYWWLIVYPSLAIGLTLFALNFLGDAIRDAFDPRLKGR